MTNTNIKVVIEMSFLTVSNINFQFDIYKLIWKSYIIAKALATTSWIKLMEKKNLLK